jgi:hypothetical protein
LQKFSSNVIDKLVCHANAVQLSLILEEFANHVKLDAVIQSQFGNFVLQNALNEAERFRDQQQGSFISPVIQLKDNLLQKI